jgi:KDO2-lipid IV(A) lauroyltransferase
MWKYLAFLFIFSLLKWLPLPALYALFGLAGRIAYYAAPGARRSVHANLRRVMPPGTSEREIACNARRVFRNVALYYADLTHLPRMNIDAFFHKRLRFDGLEENLLPAIRRGRGVIILSGHFGNPELAVQGLIPLGVRVLALTEPQSPAKLSQMMDRIRASKGHTFLPVGVSSVRQVIRALRSGGVVALMGDRDIHGPKQRLPFCGAETLMPTGPIEVALRTGAVVVPCFCRRRDKYTFEAWLEEPLELERTQDMERDVRMGTLKFLERLERRIRGDPDQWVVLESIWDAEQTGLEAPTAVAEKR